MEPEDNKEYLNRNYWEERFKVEEEYEWLVPYSGVKPQLTPLLTDQSEILIIGCGNSSLPSDLYSDGYTNVTSIDISQVLIDKMAEKHQDKLLKWVQMDMLELQFPENSFDVVIDKATMDVLQTDNEDPWCPNEEVRERVGRFYKGVHDVLKPNGILVQISFDQPHFRRKLIPESQFDISHQSIESNLFEYFFYKLTKI